MNLTELKEEFDTEFMERSILCAKLKSLRSEVEKSNARIQILRESIRLFEEYEGNT